MKIAAFQGPVVFGDADANLATTDSALAEAQSQGAEILAMPETFLHGFFSPQKFTTEYAVDLRGPFFQGVLRRFKRFECTLLLGLNERRGDDVLNTSPAIASALHEQYQQMFARHDNLPLGKQDDSRA